MAHRAFMLDFSVYKPPEEWRVNMEASWRNGASWQVSPGRSPDWAIVLHASGTLGCPAGLSQGAGAGIACIACVPSTAARCHQLLSKS